MTDAIPSPAGQQPELTPELAPELSLDPGGLIAEAYRMEGIGTSECRSIFLDWALKQATGPDPRPAIAALLARHAAVAPDHPMTAVLTEGLAPTPTPRRRTRDR